jgi:aspartokinase/homoserine dehydrogenase 1
MGVRVSIVQIGKGTIGATLVDQVAARREAVRRALGVDLVYVGIAGRGAGAFEASGIDLARWREAVAGGRGVDAWRLLEEAARAARDGVVVVVDATAEERMADLYCAAFARGFHLVSCNKKPLAGPLSDYRRVREACRSARRFWLYEVTVGAGLPVIATLRDLLDTGDRLDAVEGCFSGTLNYLCAGLDRGARFSEVLRRARDLGYTEPDPREDLSGMDVARKALILAREAGLAIEPEAVRREPFCAFDPGGDAGAFLTSAASLDGDLSARWREGAGRGRRVRYVATVDGGCSAGPREVGAEEALGRLSGPENVFVFRTARYHDHPLVVAGPGAGRAVTAAGAFGDILKVARAAARAGGAA